MFDPATGEIRGIGAEPLALRVAGDDKLTKPLGPSTGYGCDRAGLIARAGRLANRPLGAGVAFAGSALLYTLAYVRFVSSYGLFVVSATMLIASATVAAFCSGRSSGGIPCRGPPTGRVGVTRWPASSWAS